MSTKKLHTNGIANELEGASLYFNPPPAAFPVNEAPKTPASEPDQSGSNPIHLQDPGKNENGNHHASTDASMQARTHDSMHASSHESDLASALASMNDSTHANKPARTHESRQDDLIKTIRRTVRQVGKEELFVRLTPVEKNEVRDAVYRFNELYRGTGRKTFDNEICRIALRLLLEDYHENGESSILATTQAALNA